MPYINSAIRESLESGRSAMASGELNYLVTKLCTEYVNRRGKSYATINDVVGVLECAKLEFYRRLVAPYEELKRSENGDVYHG